jgi:hypothetical protein
MGPLRLWITKGAARGVHTIARLIPKRFTPEKERMREWAKALLERAHYHAVTRPLAGAALGAVVGGLYGLLCGGVLGALNGAVGLAVPWGLVAAAAGATSGFLMGVCSAVDRATRGPTPPEEPKLVSDTAPSAHGRTTRVPARTPPVGQSRQSTRGSDMPVRSDAWPSSRRAV